jgi:hypothetical protein
MTRRQLSIATIVIVASAGIIACDGQESLSPLAPPISHADEGSAKLSSTAASRRGDAFRVTKNCRSYTGRGGEKCTVTSSTLNAIKPGSTIVYASDADPTGWLDTDIVIDLPGSGRHAAFGHCSLDLVTGDGECRLTGGIGKFEELRASVVVSHLGGFDYAWEGTYTLGSRRE